MNPPDAYARRLASPACAQTPQPSRADALARRLECRPRDGAYGRLHRPRGEQRRRARVDAEVATALDELRRHAWVERRLAQDGHGELRPDLPPRARRHCEHTWIGHTWIGHTWIRQTWIGRLAQRQGSEVSSRVAQKRCQGRESELAAPKVFDGSNGTP